MRHAVQQPRSNDSLRRGFTIVELLIVIVVIGILAAVVIVGYTGIKARADEASLQSELAALNRKILAFKVTNNEALPADATAGGLTVATNHTLYYRVTPDGKNFCLASALQDNTAVVYSVVSTNGSVKKGTCEGYILVPGNAALGTNDFWVMKYEAKNVSGRALSRAADTPWVNISQTDAISTSTAACDGCHLISEAEWMTIAANVLGVPSNWSGGSVGSGYIYSGHNDNSPSNALAGSSNDTDGYNGTGQGGTSSQRRTLTLSDGEVAWDIAGNVWDWTSGTIAGGQQPGLSGETTYVNKQWTDGSLLFNGLPAGSRPSALAGAPGLAGVTGWSSSQGIGQLYSNYGEASLRGFFRGNNWAGTSYAGVLALFLSFAPSDAYLTIGFRVAR